MSDSIELVTHTNDDGCDSKNRLCFGIGKFERLIKLNNFALEGWHALNIWSQISEYGYQMTNRIFANKSSAAVDAVQ